MTPAVLEREAEALIARRRVATRPETPAARRVEALLSLAETASVIPGRVRRARELGVLDAAAVGRFERTVGLRPEALDGPRIARRCVALARRTRAWGPAAERCADLASEPRRRQITHELARPSLPAAFERNLDPAEAIDVFREARARLAARPDDARTRLALAAMHVTVRDGQAAMRTLRPLRDATRRLPPELRRKVRLAHAEALVASGRLDEAESSLDEMVAEEPSWEDALWDYLLVIDVGEPSERRYRRVLAVAQRFLCLSSTDRYVSRRESVQQLGEAAAEALGLPRERPLVPIEHMSGWHVSQERARPLASCGDAMGPASDDIPPSPSEPPASCPSPDHILAGYLPHGLAVYALEGQRLVRLPDACAPHAPETPSELGPTADVFDLGDLDGDGVADRAIVTDRVEGQFVVGREVRVLAGGRDRRVLASSVDESMRFGTDVRPAGDLDGDGRADLLISRPSACDCCDCGGSHDEVWVHRHTGEGLSRTEIIRGADGLQNWVRAIPAGDVNGDGYDDVVVAHGRELRLYHGGRGGLDAAGRLIARRSEATDGIALAPLPGGPGLWWIDFDAQSAGWLQRGTRARRLALPRTMARP